VGAMIRDSAGEVFAALSREFVIPS